MRNNIMAAGLRDRPPMLTPGRYAQWQSRFLRYIDTRPNGDALRKCILQGPYIPNTVIIPAKEAIDDSLAVPKYPYYQAPKSHKTYEPSSKQSSSTRSNASIKLKGKEIAKPITPLYESASEEDNDPEQAQIDNDMQKNSGTHCKTGQFRNQRTMSLAEAMETTDQNAEDERVTLTNLTLDTEENKKILKQLKKANTSLTQELKECKSNLEESNTTRNSCLIALQCKQTELEKYMTFNDHTVDYDKLELVKEKHDELVKQSLLTKSYYEGLVKEKTKIIHMLAPKGSTFNGRQTFANPMYLKKAQSENPCLYEIPYDTSDPANRFTLDREETLTLEKESRSKLDKDLVKPYDYIKQNSLYENFKPASKEYHDQLAHANEVRKKIWRKSFVKTKPKFFKNIGFLPNSKSISNSRQAYNVMTNNINNFRELVDQAWEKHSHDHFHAPTAHDMEILIKTCLPLALKTQNDCFTFVHEPRQEMHADLKYVELLENEIDELKSDKAEFSNMYDLLL
ncbi:hypothetical protein Tco_1218180 [Tanacetum coccineum]